MKIIYANVEHGLKESARLVNECEEGIIVNFSDMHWCACGKRAGIREDICEELGIPILKAHYLAGTNVVFPNDLSIMEVKKGYSRFGDKTIKLIRDYLLDKGLPVFINGNDLMLFDITNKESYKVGSYGSNYVGDVIESVVHFSINMDLELVKRICTKPMVKIPGELGSHGVTAEELWKVIFDSLEY